MLSIEALIEALIVCVLAGGEKGRRPTGDTDRTPFRGSGWEVLALPRILRRMVYFPPEVVFLFR